MGHVNITQLRKELGAGLKQLTPLARNNALHAFNRIKRKTFDEFNDHKVTKEIEGGQEASSSYLGRGNLYSLLGFDSDKANPIVELRDLLDKGIKPLEAPPIIEQRGSTITYSFPVETPTYEELEEATPLRWAKGRSWLTEVEKGVSGLAFYVYHRFFSKPPSFSTTGLQKRKLGVSESSLEPVKYVKEIIERLRERFKEPQ